MTAEPKMEELLASIRKAIHEDIGSVRRDYSVRGNAEPLTGSMGEMRVRADGEISAAAEIQQLRQRISRNRIPDLPLPPPREPVRFSRDAETVAPAIAEPEPRPDADPAILSAEAAAAAGTAFNRLTENFLSRAMGERPLEETAREMLRPMLKQWLDDNLPALVERLVREEIERVARRGR